MTARSAEDPAIKVGAAASVDDRPAIGLIIASMIVGACTLWAEAATEPYHIDELRQVRPYHLEFDELVRRSFTQDQPPLDVLVGARFQDVFGIGEVTQRLHGMLAGLAILAVLATLLWRTNLRFGAAVAVFALAVSPGFVSFTAYARPYALPLLLMFVFVLSTDVWLDRSSRVGAAVIPFVALLLPVSRVFEPPVFLVLTSAAVLWFRRSRPTWASRSWWPIGWAVTALIVSALPVFLKLRSQLTAYQGQDPATAGEQVHRIFQDSVPRFGSLFVNGWLALLVVALAVATPGIRARMSQIWWFWPFLATAGAFAVAFHLRTQPDTPFRDRYGYFWLPAFAIVIAVIAQEWRDGRPNGSARKSLPMIGVIVLLVVTVVGLRDDFSSEAHSDYRSIGEAVESRFEPSTALVFDSTNRPAWDYHPGYAGYGRYVDPQRPMVKVELLPKEASRIQPETEYVIATDGPALEVPGWTATPTSETMTLYVPEAVRSGPSDLASDLDLFGRALEPEFGALLRIGSAALDFSTGETANACASLAVLIEENPDLSSVVVAAFDTTELVDEFERCDLAQV